ncbi:phenylacetate--CoA ligase family protein [Carboxydothermus ferrireducens]|uniref:Phenylacetate-CoA ligase n=1 Tax=Carboxydothermus ferrireducens DSM 11255 TaxID=1119529 RepID=A0ABX2R6G3_9THEO|nr:phenylacetate--CoA ligase [Carboxydothermus ferrireducens]NYE56761.1 phenylacetate-CoA ligase [Carboxydothermus ferrireducens DSM 11255]
MSEVLAKLKKVVQYVEKNSPYYREKFLANGIRADDIKDIKDFEKLPFTTKEELRNGEPFKFLAVPEERVVRIHSSSGTTGKAVIIPYTRQDILDWTEMMKRSLEMAGVTPNDRVQITPGYGLWTAGIGFQTGVEALGAMAVPLGPGNTEKQLEFMVELKTTVLIGTSSYGLLLAEEIARRGLQSKINLKKGIFGSERWGEKLRGKIEEYLGIETYDIYGLTEIYGPGIAIDCHYHQGMHYWDDYLYFEIIDPDTGEVLPEGETGELVITTLTKEGMPLIRYRTRDITHIIPGKCTCGSPFPRIDRIIGRSDDMLKVKGVNFYPAQIDQVLAQVPEALPEYRLTITHEEGRDRAVLEVEGYGEETAQEIKRILKSKIGISFEVKMVSPGSLPRSEKKSKRAFDLRPF